jgi:hypothetical protein
MRAAATTQSQPDVDTAWVHFKSARSLVLANWVDAERAMALATRNGAPSGPSGDRLLAAEAALQSAIIDFAASQTGRLDPMPLALEMLRRAEAELFADPPDLRRLESGDRRRSTRRGVGDRRT